MSQTRQTPARPLAPVKAPDFQRETQASYYAYAPQLFEREFGRKPSRNSLYKYMIGGFPVRKGGPYVEVPVVSRLHRAMTTRQAMRRFIREVRRQEKANTGRPRSDHRADETKSTA